MRSTLKRGDCIQASLCILGNVKYSTHSIIKAKLTNNMEIYQTTIDLVFPADHHRSAKHNVLFTNILRRGYAQANGIFNSIRPANKLITTRGGAQRSKNGRRLPAI